jgi:flavodoxin
MAKVLVVYATRGGETKAIAALIAEGIRFAGAEAKCINITDIKKEADLEGYDGYVFGSATYHGEMMQLMKTMLFPGDPSAHSDGAVRRPVASMIP